MDVFNKPTAVDGDVVKNLGPLTTLAGTWEGDENITSFVVVFYSRVA